MARVELDYKPVSRITTDAIGKPGERVFYLQGQKDDQVVTLLVEKVQIQSLAIGVEQFLGEIAQQHPDLSEAPNDYIEDAMHIQPPVDPLFRIGEMGLGYDAENDLVVLVAREVLSEGLDAEQASVVRFWCTRSQIRAMCNWGTELANRGRPLCPYCGEPMEPEGHFCPKKNGHKH
jgi:uncharacterized repeat protein (TIGR03847 family)